MIIKNNNRIVACRARSRTCGTTWSRRATWDTWGSTTSPSSSSRKSSTPSNSRSSSTTSLARASRTGANSSPTSYKRRTQSNPSKACYLAWTATTVLSSAEKTNLFLFITTPSTTRIPTAKPTPTLEQPTAASAPTNRSRTIWGHKNSSKTLTFGSLPLPSRKGNPCRESPRWTLPLTATTIRIIKFATCLPRRKEKKMGRRLSWTIDIQRDQDLTVISSKCWRKKCWIRVPTFNLMI